MQKTCIVVPCYNEAERLDFNEFSSFLETESSVVFLFSNDGSTDRTQELLDQFMRRYPLQVKVLHNAENAGKAEAVRKGILSATEQFSVNYFGFWDADLATPLTEINHLLHQINHNQIAIGSRMKRLGAIVERKASRHFLGRVFSTFASLILRLPVYDTQCGAKIFKSDLKFLFEEKFLTSWLFDVELLARYRNKYGKSAALNSIIEVPVNCWKEKGGSKLKMKHLLRVPLELYTIHQKYNH